MMSAQSEQGQHDANTFVLFRGGMLAAFGQIEFAICRTMSKLQASNKLNANISKLPKKVVSRANLFKQQFKDVRQLQPYSERATSLIDEFLSLLWARNAFAHGFAKIDVDRALVELRVFKERNSDTWHEDIYSIGIDEIPTLQREIETLTSDIIRLVIELDERFDLGF